MRKVDLRLDGRPCQIRIGVDHCEFRGRRMATDIEQLGPCQYSVIVDGAQHTVVLSGSRSGGYTAQIGGASVRVEICDPRRLSAGGKEGGRSETRQICAKMPGKVVAVHARAGDRVAQGQPLLVVEAMKMQNELCANAGGKIAKIAVQPGDSVLSGEVLVTFE